MSQGQMDSLTEERIRDLEFELGDESESSGLGQRGETWKGIPTLSWV